MKALRILGFALTVSFLAPLAQAAPTVAPEPSHFEAPAPAAAEDRRTDPPPQPAPERHEAYLPPRVDSGPSAPPDRDRHHEDSAPAVTVVQTPDTDDSQDSPPVDYSPTNTPTDNSCGSSEADTGHYTIDDLVNAAASLDAPYGPTHFSMDDIGGL